MKNTLKTTLFALAGFTVLTVSAQKPPKSVAGRRSADVETGSTKENSTINNKSNNATDGKTINANGTTKSANTNLKGQNDVSATQSSSSKPAATTTSITSSKVTTSNTGSTTEKKGVETRGARKPK